MNKLIYIAFGFCLSVAAVAYSTANQKIDALTRIADQMEPISLAAARINYVVDSAIEAQTENPKFDIVFLLSQLGALSQLNGINDMLGTMTQALSAMPPMEQHMRVMAARIGSMDYSMKRMDSMSDWMMP